jgi:hypothetical protein
MSIPTHASLSQNPTPKGQRVMGTEKGRVFEIKRRLFEKPVSIAFIERKLLSDNI